jgi:hypothetical protein
MGDREKTDRENQERQSNAGKPLPPILARIAPDPKQPHSNEIQNQANADPERPDPWFKNPAWHMVWITLFLFAVGVYTAKIFHRQFKEMQAQTKILNSQAKQAASDSVESARKVDSQLTIARQQAKAAQDSADAIKTQMRVDQRAWISLGSIKSVSKFAVGEPFTVTVGIKNLGKTPARNTYTGIFIEPRLKGQKPRLERDAQVAMASGIILPNVEIYNSPILTMCSEVITNTGQILAKFICPLTQDEYDAVTSGSQTIYVHGRVTYYDVFNHSHWFTFCYLMGANETWVMCTGGQRADNDRE